MTQVLLAFAFGSVLAASAGPVPYSRFQITDADYSSMVSREYGRCIDKSGGVTVAMRGCSAAEFDRLDEHLNRQYRQGMWRLPSGRARLFLRLSQRGWLNTRWAACAGRLVEEGRGTMALLEGDSCRLAEMARRTVWLRRY